VARYYADGKAIVAQVSHNALLVDKSDNQT
jgi:hypothetical protein